MDLAINDQLCLICNNPPPPKKKKTCSLSYLSIRHLKRNKNQNDIFGTILEYWEFIEEGFRVFR